MLRLNVRLGLKAELDEDEAGDGAGVKNGQSRIGGDTRIAAFVESERDT